MCFVCAFLNIVVKITVFIILIKSDKYFFVKIE